MAGPTEGRGISYHSGISFYCIFMNYFVTYYPTESPGAGGVGPSGGGPATTPQKTSAPPPKSMFACLCNPFGAFGGKGEEDSTGKTEGEKINIIPRSSLE